MSNGAESSNQPARGLALRLRKAIISSFKTDSNDLTTLFHSISEGADTITIEVFKEFSEEMLDIVIKPAEGKAMYQLYDTNGDGKVSLTDFLGFINSATFTAKQALSRGSADMIVDMQISDSGPLDQKLLSQGYTQLQPDSSQTQGRVANAGSFGRGQSVWVWRYGQGTCCGRLKPIVAIHLDTSSTSSALVISGYTCLGLPVSGQWVWVKRATTQEEEKDAIVDFKITCGKAKNPTDKVWQPPGVGWVRVDGNFNRGLFAPYDAFLWFRPLRSRSEEHIMASPLRDIINFSEENRKAALFTNVRRALRNYVPVDDMLRLAQYSSKEEESINAPTNFDFAAIYHVFSKGIFSDRMGFSKMKNMLTAVGCPIDSTDMDFCFHTLDMNQNGYISREDFTFLLELSPDEQDEAIVFAHSSVYETIKGTSKLKHSQLFVEMFKMINANGDGVLSLPEILNFYAQLGVYLTPSEGRSIMQIMDVKGKDRLEEGDFVSFMSTVAKESAMVRRAFRVREASERLRRWLIRSLNLSSGTAGSNAQTEPTFWRELRERHHRSRGTSFPGYLSSTDLCTLAARLGYCLSTIEGKQLCLIVAPSKSGRVHQSDLLAFMNSSCRQFGELLAMLERDILKPVVEVAKERKEALSANDEHKVSELDKEYALIIAEIEQTVSTTAGGLGAEQKGSVSDIVSLEQIKSGIQTVMHGYSTPEAHTPNVEEWALLSALTGAMVAEGDTYGIKTAKLITGICSYAIGDLSLSGSSLAGRSVFNFEALCRELQALIVDEARAAAARKTSRPGAKVEKYDFQAVFALFDEDGEGTISLAEFRKMLSRLNVLDEIPVDKIPDLLMVFDPSNKNVVTYPNFVEFAMDKRYGYHHDEDDLSDGDFDEEDDELPSSSAVPAAITQNADADWLVWNIWKNAMKKDYKDPERVITDLEASCAEVELETAQGVVSDKDLWFILSEINLKDNISKSQFETGALYYAIDPKKKIAGGIDFESFCRGIVRMGRAYNTQMQDRKKAETELYNSLKLSLQKEIADMMDRDVAESAVKIPNSRHSDRAPEQNVTKIFRRLDTDGDGQLTVLEFKNALKRLKLNNVKKWNNRMIRRLFEDCDKNRDGRLNLSEFFQFIRDGMQSGGAGKTDLFTDPTAYVDLNADDDFAMKEFRAQRVISDNELYRKVMATLYDAVRTSANPNDDHTEVVKATVRKYFQSADPGDKGHVEEERFRAFCRRSGLHDALSTSELRILTERLRKPSSSGNSASSRINYEKFLAQLSNSASGIPHSVGDAVLTKLQDAVDEASASGRPFLGLCSLIDPKERGVMSRQELLHTFKMISCLVCLDALAEILPSTVFLSDGDVNYKELNNALLGGLTPRVGDLFANPRDRDSRGMRSVHGDNPYSGALTPATLPRSRARPTVGALPLYATPKSTTRGSAALYNSRGATISTPAGISIAIPTSARDSDDGGTIRGRGVTRNTRRSGVYDTASLDELYVRVLAACDTKGREMRGQFSIKKQLNVYDYENSGFVSLQTFQSTLEDLGVSLTVHEINALMQTFGDSHEEVIDYAAFCQALDAKEARLDSSRIQHGM